MEQPPLAMPEPLPPEPNRLGAVGAIIGTAVGGVVSYAAGIGVGILAAVIVLAGAGIDMGAPDGMQQMMDAVNSLAVVGPSVIAQHGCLLLVPFLVVKLRKRDVKESLGLKGAPWGTFLLAPIGILALGPTSDFLARMYNEYIGWTFGNLEMIEQLVEKTNPWALWPFVALIPGFSEEMMFRGLLQRGLGSGWKAITVSALVFSCFHLDPPHVVGVIPLGFYLAWVAARTGSTWTTILAHAVNNSAAIFAVALAGNTAHDEQLPWWAMPTGWVIGGACIAGIWWLTRARGGHVAARIE